MSTIVDERDAFGKRLRGERQGRGWSIDRLAEASGVSRAMISKIERGESSPTAVLLGKLSAALELSVSELLTGARLGDGQEPAQAEAEPPSADGTGAGLVRRAADTPQWRDPDTGYLRRQISTAGFPAAVTEVTLPPHARVPYPAAAYAFIAQLVWVQSGQLTLTDGSVRRVLASGDTFELGQPRSREFRNETAEECRYVVVVTRKSTS
jgi:transcriptional regulator with XRE-family HTH domain